MATGVAAFDAARWAAHVPRSLKMGPCMRRLATGLALAALTVSALAACASGPEAATTGTRPPVGKGPAGTDFGYWNRDAEGSVDQAFRSHITATYKVADTARAQKTLEADGFRCQDGNRPDGQPVPALECTRQVKVNEDVHAWSVQFWPSEPRPRARYTRTHVRDPLRNYDESPKRN